MNVCKKTLRALSLSFLLLFGLLPQLSFAQEGGFMLRVACNFKASSIELQPFVLSETSPGVFKYKDLFLNNFLKTKLAQMGGNLYYYFDKNSQPFRSDGQYVNDPWYKCSLSYPRVVTVKIDKNLDARGNMTAPILIIDDVVSSEGNPKKIHFSIDLTRGISGFNPLNKDNKIDYTLKSTAYGIWTQCVGVNKIVQSYDKGASFDNLCLTINRSGDDQVREFVK